jgi:predicted nucleic acid-binding protein
MESLIDTSVWIASVGDERFTEWSRQQIEATDSYSISPIVSAELSLGVYTAENEAVRAKRTRALEAAAGATCVSITDETAEIHAKMMARIRMNGTTRARAHDLWLAATALEHDLTIITCNRRDFADVRGLKFLAPE